MIFIKKYLHLSNLNINIIITAYLNKKFNIINET